MTDHTDAVATLARDLVAIDSRSFVSNLKIAERVEAALSGFEIERIDYTDAAGTAKRALVAARGVGGLGMSGHMDTVPDTGWQEDPWSGRIDDAGVLHGLGSTDMKGPVAALIVAARALPERIPVCLLITTDEETTKGGAIAIAERSKLARRAAPKAIVVAEPTNMAPVRGHRSHVEFYVTSTGVQAHSSTGRGRNANWDLLPFLNDMKKEFDRLRSDRSVQDDAYDPPFSDFNLVIDNFGTANNVAVPKAQARIKYRYSAKIDPASTIDAVKQAAARAGLTLEIRTEGKPPELAADHPLIRLCAELTGKAPGTAPYGTDASELQDIAPCVIMGPGDIARAHTPQEWARLSDTAGAVPVFMQLADRIAAG